MCWAESEEEAQDRLEIWPNAALGGDLGYELPRPRHFEQACENVTEEDIGEAIPCGPDRRPLPRGHPQLREAGYTHIYFTQIGRDQEGFFRFLDRGLALALTGPLV